METELYNVASPFYVFLHYLFPRLDVWDVLDIISVTMIILYDNYIIIMMSVSTEQEPGKKCSFGTLEIIVPLDQACLFCMCRNIRKKRARGYVNWSNLHLCSSV